jgi:hypothetical protein
MGNIERVRRHPQSYEEVLERVVKSGGVRSWEMGVLRDVHKAGKLGNIVVENISKELDQRGLGHYPNPLPVNQEEGARIYKRGTPVGDVIHAVLSRPVDQKTDKLLREIGANRADDILKKIKELVCD